MDESRQAVMQCDTAVEMLLRQTEELVRSAETPEIGAVARPDAEADCVRNEPRDLIKDLEALEEQARVLTSSVESLRLQTIHQCDDRIEALRQQSRDLSTIVENARIHALDQSNQEIRKLNKGLEWRILERTAQLEAANKELDSFSYSISHDLRAPLRAIDGFTRILLEDHSASLAVEGKTYLQMVRDNTTQMGKLVDELVRFVRVGRQPLARQPIDQKEMVRQCLDEMTKERECRQVEFVVGELPPCSADLLLLKQVWTNLLSNALKYTRKRNAARIEIGCRTQPRLEADGLPPFPENAGPDMVYFVKDNGAGFDMKRVRKLFGVFQRLHRAADYEGTGMGLAIVQRIVQRHGGRVWAEAKPGEGATFSFTLT